MKARTTFNDAAEKVRQAIDGVGSAPVSQPDPWQCAAHGCPMFGSMSDQVAGTVARRWCSWHFGQGSKHEGRITSMLRNRMALVNAVRALRKLIAEPEPITERTMNPIVRELRAAAPDGSRYESFGADARGLLRFVEGELHAGVFDVIAAMRRAA